jgi:hypothetical protein
MSTFMTTLVVQRILEPVWNDLESIRAMIVDHGPDLHLLSGGGSVLVQDIGMGCLGSSE